MIQIYRQYTKIKSLKVLAKPLHSPNQGPNNPAAEKSQPGD